MPGDALTNEFFLSTATVMLGPMADMKSLNPAEHSVGLVKNFQLQSDPTLVELTQGITNDVVASVMTNRGLKCSFEMYEYTAKNLAYASGLDGTAANYAAFSATHVNSGAVDADDTEFVVATDVTATYTAGSWVFFQKGTGDLIHIAKVLSVAYSSPDTTITLAAAYAIPWAAGIGAAKVGKINKIDIVTDLQKNFAMKIVGVLPNEAKPLVLVFPKVKVSRGLAINFATDNWSNMPFELTPYKPVAADPGYDADFSGLAHILRQ